MVTPAFELADVFERGLGPDGAARLLRFVDPQNGEVLALRSDITPQIARLLVGPMKDAPLPVRLCYFGRVFRLRQHSEFQRREVVQAGVELVGADGPEADVEVLRLCDKALTAAGPHAPILSLGHVGVIDAVLTALGPAISNRSRVVSLLRRKDAAGLCQTLDEVGAPRAASAAAVELCSLYGEPVEILGRARRTLSAIAGVSEALDRLTAVLSGLDFGDRLLLDLGEMLGFGYYTGVVFHAYLRGSGQSVASGGRYDELLGRYGRELAACGFAIDEEGLCLQWS